jgi:hypothetical protein
MSERSGDGATNKRQGEEVIEGPQGVAKLSQMIGSMRRRFRRAWVKGPWTGPKKRLKH